MDFSRHECLRGPCLIPDTVGVDGGFRQTSRTRRNFAQRYSGGVATGALLGVEEKINLCPLQCPQNRSNANTWLRNCCGQSTTDTCALQR
jgi:hypothetical protein